jgi:stearoyl-CoA desaturase (delta-9 desaturase)
MIEVEITSACILGLFLAWLANWCLTAYFHRMCAHKSITINEPLLTFVRIYTWMTQFGITAPSWVGMHIMHHRYEDTEKDPHSPKFKNFWKLFLIRSWGRNYNMNNRKIYIEGIKRCPWDKTEKFFVKNSDLGFILFLLISVGLFGLNGLIIWSIVIGITSFSNIVIVTFAHTIGYKHTNNTLATNNPIFLFFLAGEEWHNNHHANPKKSNFGGNKWWEIDTGYCLIWAFSKIGLIKINS